jgi:hypothetical protein
MPALQDVKDYLASVGVPAGRYTDAALLQVIAVESAAQIKACRVPSAELPSGLSLQFRASDLDTLVDGAAVSSWASAVGTSVATQGIGSAQPTKRTVDGRDLVRFDGTDYLSLSGDALALTQNAIGGTLLARVKLNSTVAGTQRLLAFSYGAGLSIRLYTGMFGGNWQIIARRLDGDSSLGAGSVASDQSVHTWAFALDWARGVYEIAQDGVSVGSGSSGLTAGATSNTPSNAVVLGAGADATSPLFGDLYELLYWPRVLTSAERLAAEDYLSGGGLPWPLREALCRRVQVNLAKRALPLGVIDQSSDGGGSSFVPRIDPEVRRLEAPYRKLVVG